MVAQNRPAMQETRIQYLGWEDLLEEGMATHSSILAWKTPWTEEPGGLHSIGHKELDRTEVTEHTHTHTHIRAHTHTHTHFGLSQVVLVVKNPPANARDIRKVG